MNKERAKEILIKHKKQSDLFNWCDEYNKFVGDNVCCLVNEEAEFMLKKSYEDSESPLSYDDLDLNDYDGLREEIIYKIEEDYKTTEEQNELREEINLVRCGDRRYLDISEEQSFKDFINELDDDDLNTLSDSVFQIELNQREIFQWFIVSSDLAHAIKEHDGLILNENWFGRECCGQSLTLDSMFMDIYLDRLKNWFTEEELKQIE